jgi:cyclic pyranopterin phosphate synthase
VTGLTHIDAEGSARMVDVGGKAVTTRIGVASGRITMSAEAATAIRRGTAKKGDVLAVARVARTSDLIPLCHPLPLSSVDIALDVDDTGVTATATTSTDGKTGVEMEALTAVSVTLLTVYDMAKAIDKGMILSDIRLLSKRGGKSGDWTA